MSRSAEARGQALVMGLGRFGGGAAVVRHLASRGWTVTVTDAQPRAALAASVAALADLDVEWVLGEHRQEDFRRAALVVANPAVRPDHPLLALAREAGARVCGELELLLQGARGRLVLVTGTQGKSSTCQMLAALASRGGLRVHLGGNIGSSLLASLDDMREEDVGVVEVSSYQLEALPPEPPAGPAGRNWTPTARVAAVAVTNVLADHLERHGSRAAYAAAKRRLLELLGAGGAAFLPADGPATKWTVEGADRFTHGGPDADLALEGDRFGFRGETLATLSDLRLPGRFQRPNALLALGLARWLGVPAAALPEGLRAARGLDHRLQDLGLVRGHRVWDNGVSTTPDSTASALASMEGPCTLLCGGLAKDLPLGELARVTARRARRVVVFGRDGERLARAFAEAGLRVERCGALADAVRLAFARLQPGESLLFSPACASFDAFANFRERALAFRAALPAEARGVGA